MKIRRTAMEFMFIPTEPSTKVIGRMICSMGKA
jgi:hypothetical protein